MRSFLQLKSLAYHKDVLRDIVTRIRWATVTWTPPECAANTTTDTTLTSVTYPDLEGLRTGQYVTVTPPALTAGLVMGGAVCADNNQITIRIGNLTGSPISPSAGEWVIWGGLIT